MYVARRRIRRQRGKGFMDVLKKVGAFLKKTQLVSKVGRTLGSVGVPYAGMIGNVAGSLGYGRRRRVGRPRVSRVRGQGLSLAGGMYRRPMRQRRQRGKGFMDVLKKVGAFLKKTQLVSKVANTLGSAGIPYAGAIGSVASSLGYGRRRRVGRPRTRSTMAKKKALHTALMLAGHGLSLAGGRRRRTRRVMY